MRGTMHGIQMGDEPDEPKKRRRKHSCLTDKRVVEVREALQQYMRNHPIPEGFNRICKALNKIEKL